MKQKKWANTYLIFLIAVFGIFLLEGCIHIKGNDDYEFIAPPEMLRQIEPIELNEVEEKNEVYTPDREEPELAELEISLQECRALALENNLDLKAQLINPIIAAERVTQEEAARFDATFSAGTTYRKINSPVVTTLEIAGAKRDTTTSNFGFYIPLRTGGNISLGMFDVRTKTDSLYSIYNPSYNSYLSAFIRHPLLRGAGKRSSTYPIRYYEYERQITDARTKRAVIDLIAAVEKTYWQLYADRQMLDMYKLQYELKKDLFEETKRLVEIGITGEIELYRTQSEFHESLNDIITAENSVRNTERSLKRILNKPGLGLETQTVLIPTTEPDPVSYKINKDQMIANAIENRMDMLELELQLAQDSSKINNLRNQALPQINMEYGYNMSGLGKGRNDSYDVLFDNDFHGHSIGLRFNFPLRNRGAKSEVRHAIYRQKQRLAQRDIKMDQIKGEVLSQIDRLETYWHHIQASRQKTIVRDQEYKAEKRLYGLGINTSTDVFQAQSGLTDAQSSEINALTQYQKALVDLAVATGTFLGATKVQWEPFVPEI